MNIRLQAGYLSVLILLVLFFSAIPASADEYVGGIPLRTVEHGVVSGGLYYDAVYGLSGNAVEKTFVLPAYTEISWARLYVVVYCGHMQNNFQADLDVRFDGDGNGMYDRSWREHLNVEYSFPGEGGGGPVIVGPNGNRVTSDYLFWYDVSDIIRGSSVKAGVTTTRPSGYTGTFDGRIKLVALVVAYDDGSTDQVYYWINQGHDTSTHRDEQYVGQTYFDLPDIDEYPVSAALSVIHLSSMDGRYWINGQRFEGRSITQGSYSGSNRWDVLDLVDGRWVCTLEYQKLPDHTFYKIPLAFLEIAYPQEVPRTGEIIVESAPSGAWVYLDGVNTTHRTPTTLRDVLVGEHTIFLKKDGYHDAFETAVVYEDDTTFLFIELDRLPYDPEDGRRNGVSRSSGYHGDILTLYRSGAINGTMVTSSAGLYTGLLTRGRGDENTHEVNLPENATIIDARLYVYTTWGHNARTRAGIYPDISVHLDGRLLAESVVYTDRKGVDPYDYPLSTHAFDLLDTITESGNYTFLITNSGQPDDVFALYGSVLLILAEVPDAPLLQYWIYEGCDVILADPAFGTTSEDATTTVEIHDAIDVEQVSVATLSVLSTAGSGMPEKDNMVIFNGMEWPNTLTGGSSEISIATLPVQHYLMPEENRVSIQSYAPPGGQGDYIENRNVFFFIRMADEQDDVDVIAPGLELPRPDAIDERIRTYTDARGRLSGGKLYLNESNVMAIISPGTRIIGSSGEVLDHIGLSTALPREDSAGYRPERAFMIEPEGATVDIPLLLTISEKDTRNTLLFFDTREDRWMSFDGPVSTSPTDITARISRTGLYGVGFDRMKTPSIEEKRVFSENRSFFTHILSIHNEMNIHYLYSEEHGAKRPPVSELTTVPEQTTIPVLPDDTDDGDYISPQITMIDQSNLTYDLTVRSNPPGALIILNGEYIGRVTPFTINDLRGGRHSLELTCHDYHPVHHEVDLTMDMTVVKDLLPLRSGLDHFKVPDPMDYEAEYGGIYIDSRPDGADIYLNGRRIERQTPYVIYGIPPGSHTIRLRHGKATFPVEMKEVWVRAGAITPVSFVPHDDFSVREFMVENEEYYGLRFSINGFFPPATVPSKVEISGIRRYITIQTDTSYLTFPIPGSRVDWTLPATGSIFVDSNPQGAYITLDGFDTGCATPAVIENVSAGLHRISVSKPGFLPVEEEFRMRPSMYGGISESFDYNLQKYFFGTLHIESDPPGARIYLYGQNTHHTTPQSFSYLNIGTYTVRLISREGSSTFEATVLPYQVTEVKEILT